MVKLINIKRLDLDKVTISPVGKIKCKSVLIIPTTQIHHDSGYNLIEIASLNNNQITARFLCDVIFWEMLESQSIKTDLLPNGIFHYFSNDYDFEITNRGDVAAIKIIKRTSSCGLFHNPSNCEE